MNDFVDDQMDFHTYSMRKGSLVAYIECVPAAALGGGGIGLRRGERQACLRLMHALTRRTCPLSVVARRRRADSFGWKIRCGLTASSRRPCARQYRYALYAAASSTSAVGSMAA